jgi:hypothetical protein
MFSGKQAPRRTLKCSFCNSEGHTARTCPTKRSDARGGCRRSQEEAWWIEAGERRGGRAPGTPNKTTAIISAAMNAVAANAAAHPAITPLEFMLVMMADPNVDPSLRF